MDTTTKLITVREAANILNISLPKMYELANSKGFPAVNLGGNGRKCYRIDAQRLRQWIEKGGMPQ